MPLSRYIALLLIVPICSSDAAAQVELKAKKAGDPAIFLHDAEAAEKAGNPDRALELFLRAYLGGRATPEIRDRIRELYRIVGQHERHRDPAFRQFVLSLKPSESLELYSEVISKIHVHYADRSKVGFDRLYVAGLVELERALGDENFRKVNLKVTDERLAKFLASLRETWRAKSPGSAKEATQAARDLTTAATKQLGLTCGSIVVLELLCGACSGLDEFSVYAPPSERSSEIVSPVIEFRHYGLIVRLSSGGIDIESVRPGSWAAHHTKLHKGQRIIRFNDVAVKNPTAEQILGLMRSTAGRGYRLELESTDESPEIVKLPTPRPTVYGLTMADDKAGIGYIRLAAFDSGTLDELDESIRELKHRGMKALIVDLRGNGGGLLTAAIDVAGRFLPSGLIVSTQGQSSDFADRPFASDSGMRAHDFPVVLLVDTETMSAAEMLALGLKERERATLIGLPTFGKGVVQSPIALSSLDGGDAGAAKSGTLILTVASLFGPRGTPVGAGVAPHVVEADPDRQMELAIRKAIDALPNASRMPRLMR